MNRHYRVLHVIDSFGLGGAQEMLYHLVKYCDRDRFEPEVATLHGRGKYYEMFRDLGVPVHSFSPHKIFPLYLARIPWRCLTRKYDLVHCHLIASNLIAKPLAALCGVRIRFNHDQCNDEYRYRDRLRLRLDSWSNHLTTHAIAVSHSTREFLLRWEAMNPDRVTMIPNAVDLDRFRPRPDERMEARTRWGIPPDVPVVGGIGRLNYQKNFPLFLAVAARVVKQHPGVVFVIAGEGPERQRLQSLAGELNLGDRVRFLGLVQDMTTLYPALDVFLLTSLFEGTPLSVLEAMATRVATVATKVDGTAEVLEDEKDGFLVAPGDEQAFAARVLLLLHDRYLHEQIVEAAYQKARTRYSAEAITRQVEGLYLRYLEAEPQLGV